MLMIWGLFVFSVPTAPFNSKERTTNYRWASNDRVGNSPAYQFVGQGEDEITLSGVLMPEFSGGPMNLNMLRMMASAGESFLLMSGSGEIYGYYFVDSISQAEEYFFDDGTAQKIDFTISLKRYDSVAGVLGAIAPLIPLITSVF